MFVALGVALAATPFLAAQEKTADVQPTAQEKGAKKQAANQGMYRYVSGNETLTHGDEVTLTRKGEGGKVKGTFVWMDPKSNRLYIRPEAGAAPVAVAADDIDKMERVTPVANVQDKGGVRPAINDGDPQARPNSEIHVLEIYNGTTKSVHHFGDKLSRAERERLAEIDRAAADVADKRLTIQSLSRSVQNMGTDTGTAVVQTAAAPPTLPYWAYPFYDYYAPGGYATPYYYPSYGPYAGPMYGLGYGAGYGLGYGYGGYGMGAAPSTVVVQTSGGGGASRSDLMKSLGEAQTALANAQKSYAAVQNNAVYGSGGQIIAVRMPE